MFSLKSGLPIAIVVGGKDNGTIIYLDKNSKAKEGINSNDFKQITIEDAGEIRVLPNTLEHEILYVSGPSGSGKTTYISEYLKKYKKTFPKKDIFVISSIPHDEPLDKLGVKRIDVTDPDLAENPISVEELQGSIVVFDDHDSIDDKEIQKEMFILLEKVIKRGRVKSAEKMTIEDRREQDIDVVIVNHQLLEYRKTRNVLNELTSITVFPGSGSTAQIEGYLTRYFGLKKTQISEIFDMIGDSRWVTFYKRYPNYVVYQKGMMMLARKKLKLKKTSVYI